MRPPILCVHGAFGQAANFEPWVDYFRGSGFRCSALSLPGHGPSDPKILRRVKVEDYLAAIAEAAASLGEPPVIIGHSMGGLLALLHAMRAECAGLVLVAAPAPGHLPAQLNGFRYALPLLPRILAGLPVSPAPGAMRALAIHDLSSAEGDEIVAQMGMESGRVLRHLAFGRVAVAWDRIACPILCLSGGKDRVVPRAAAYTIAEASGAEHIVFPGHGHWLIAGSLAGSVAASVRDWLMRRVCSQKPAA